MVVRLGLNPAAELFIDAIRAALRLKRTVQAGWAHSVDAPTAVANIDGWSSSTPMARWSTLWGHNHIFLGDRTIDFTTPAGVFRGSDGIRQDVDMGLVRVNYRWGGPAIARY